MSWNSSVQRRTSAARTAARQEHAAAAQSPANRRGVFQNPFARRSPSGANGGARHAEPLRSHVQNLTGAQVCPTSRQRAGGSLSVAVSTQPKSVEKKEKKGFGVPGPFDDIAKKGLNLAADVVKAGGRLALNGAEVLVDAGSKTINFIGDVAGGAPGPVGDVLEFAAENGLKLAGQARGVVRNFVRDRIDDTFHIGDRIHNKNFGVNDSFTLGGSVSAAFGIDAGASSEIKVTHTKDGYTVSSELNAHVGAGLEVNGDVGLGGRAEFKFTSAEAATKAALILAGVNASAASPLLAPALIPSGSDFNFLKNHLSSLDVTGSVAGTVDDKFGAGPVEAGVEAGAKIANTYRLEFEGGKPTALVRSTQFSLNVGADAALKLIEKPLGHAPGNKLTAALTQGGELNEAVTVETRLRLDSTKLPQLAKFLSNPAAAVFVGGAETSVKASFELDGGGRGVEEEVGVSGLSGKEARHVVNDLLHGRVGEAFNNLSVDPFASVSYFRDNGKPFHLDAKAANVGIDISGYSETRDVRDHIGIGAD